LGANVPHGALAFGVAATCRPDGNASLKLTPVNDVPEFGLVKVNASVTVPPCGVVVSGTVAVPLPDDASPVLPSVYVNVVVVGTLAMVKVPLYQATPTLPIFTLWPARKPCGAVVVIVTVAPDSVAPVGDAAIGFTNSNALLIVGGWVVGADPTVRVADPVLPVPPLVDVTCTLLFCIPLLIPCTLTETAHDPLLATEPPLRLMEPAPPVAINVPPHVLVAAEGVPTTIPLGNVSVNATPLNATLELGFVMVNVKVLIPPNAIELGAKPLAIDGGDTTVSVWELSLLGLNPPAAL
jgi:hypothetical protein